MGELEKYVEMMAKVYGLTQWEIGWESLPKYIGHRIFNIDTLEIVTVAWDNGFPEMIKENGERGYFCCSDFRHDRALWIYKSNETYS